MNRRMFPALVVTLLGLGVSGAHAQSAGTSGTAHQALFMIFFDWDSPSVSARAKATIRQAAQAFRAGGRTRMVITGHTDTSQDEARSMALSLSRANSVRELMVQEGVPGSAILVVARGKTQLLVPTPDGVREPQNRRVEIGAE